MWRRAALAAVLAVSGIWFAGQTARAQAAGGAGWIFKPSYQSTVRFQPRRAAKADWRQRLFFGGQATGSAVYGYDRTHIHLRGHSGGRYSGFSGRNQWESFYSVPSGF